MAHHRHNFDATAQHPSRDATIFLALMGSLAMVSFTVAGAIF
jgi:hypothetical protein